MASNSPWHRLYNTKQWKLLRKVQLAKQPLCETHLELKQFVVANTVDHITAHKGDPVLFYDPRNLASMCKHCHDSHKQRLEKSGTIVGCDVAGNPINKNAAWYKS